MSPLINILSDYQQKLRLTFLQAAQWVLVFAILSTVNLLWIADTWPNTVKLVGYVSGALALLICLYRLRSRPAARLEQQIGIGLLFLCATLYMFAAPQAELLVGTICFIAILFNCVVSDGVRTSLRWYAISALLYIGALSLRNYFPALRLDYHREFVMTIYLFPVVLGWGCLRYGSRIIQYLSELLQTSEALQAELKQRDVQYEQLLQSMNEGFTVVDEHDLFTYVNDKFCEIFGYTRTELLNKRSDEVLIYDEVNRQILKDQSVMRAHNQSSSYELTTQHKNGTPIQLLVSAMPKFENGDFRGALCVVMDITERKIAEEALRAERALLSDRVQERTASLHAATAALQNELQVRKQSEEEQAHLIDQLAKAARLKDEFLASMSHELRTPLNSILGMAEALQDKIYGELTERQSKALGTVETSGRHLLALINDILDLAKIESGQIDLAHEAVDVLAVCESCVRLIQPVARKKEQTVSFTLEPQIKVMLADGRRLKQLLINLLSNAQKFTPTGGKIGLEVTALATKPSQIVFIVWDTGVGIPEDAMPQLFEPFMQVDSSLSRSYEGTGLGLALVKGVAELHGGDVTVESCPGQGSRFTVTLPWLRPENLIEHKRAPVLLPEPVMP